jgi:hypothetical protein
MSAVFMALAEELARGRWFVADLGSDATCRLPRPGLRFGYRQNRRLYCGEVLECLRPVSIVIIESWRGPAGSISARQRWRLDSIESETRLAGELCFQPNRFARLHLRFWKAHFAGRVRATCACVAARLHGEGGAVQR